MLKSSTSQNSGTDHSGCVYSFLLTLTTALVWEKFSDFTIQFHIAYNKELAARLLDSCHTPLITKCIARTDLLWALQNTTPCCLDGSGPVLIPGLRMQLAESLRRPLGAVCPATPSPPLPVWSLGQSLQEVSSLLLLPSQALINGPSPCSSDGES